MTSCLDQQNPEAVVQMCSVKKVFLKISQNSREAILAKISLLKLLASGLQLFLEKDPNIGVFIIAKFLRTTFFIEHFGSWFWRSKPNVGENRWFEHIRERSYKFD